MAQQHLLEEAPKLDPSTLFLESFTATGQPDGQTLGCQKAHRLALSDGPGTFFDQLYKRMVLAGQVGFHFLQTPQLRDIQTASLKHRLGNSPLPLPPLPSSVHVRAASKMASLNEG